MLNLFQQLVYSQPKSVSDSLISALNDCKDEKCRVLITIELSKSKVFSESIEAIKLAKEASDRALKTGDNDLIAEAYIHEAYVHRHSGNYEISIDKYFLCIKHSEKTKNFKFIGSANAQVGIIYMLQKDFKTGLEKLLAAEGLLKKVEDNWARGKLYDAIATCYLELKDRENAEKNFEVSEYFFIKSENYSGISQMMANRVELYFRTGELKKAEEKLKKVLFYAEKANSNNAWTQYYLTRGKFELISKNYLKSKENFEKSLDYANRYSSNEAKYNSFDGLYQANELLSDYKNALKYHILKSSYGDSLSNNDLIKNLTKAQANYEYSKKHLFDSLSYEKEKAVKNIEIKEKDNKLKGEKQFRTLLYGIIILVLIFAGFVLKSYLDKSKTNKIIRGQKEKVEAQKYIIEEKQKEIIDSINYAKRIQIAHLPSEKYIAKKLNDLKGKNKS